MNLQEIGTTGAKRQSFRTPSPRELLRNLIEALPAASEDILLRRFTDIAMGDDDLIMVILEYWFTNNLRSLKTRPINIASSKLAEQARAETMRQRIDETINQRARVILLTMVMPNGKMLRDCSGRECSALSKKIGPWLKAIAAKIGPTRLVGDSLTEIQVRKLYDVK